MSTELGPQDLLDGAVAADADAYQALFAGRMADAHASFEAAAVLLPGVVGVGAAAQLRPPGGPPEVRRPGRRARGRGRLRARAARRRVRLPTSCYALAIAALVEGDDARAADAAAAMAEGGDPFARAGRALGALAAGDRDRYAAA